MKLAISVLPELIGQANDRNIDIERLVTSALIDAIRSGKTAPARAMAGGTTQIQVEVPTELVDQAIASGIKIDRCVNAALDAELERESQRRTATGPAARRTRRGILGLLPGDKSKKTKKKDRMFHWMDLLP